MNRFRASIFTLFLFASTIVLHAFPMAPVGILELYQRSDLVVVGTVEQKYLVEQDKKGDWVVPEPEKPVEGEVVEIIVGSGGMKMAVLKSVQIVKGKVNRSPIQVRFWDGFMCPPSARYRLDSESVLTFLRSSTSRSGSNRSRIG